MWHIAYFEDSENSKITKLSRVLKFLLQSFVILESKSNLLVFFDMASQSLPCLSCASKTSMSNARILTLLTTIHIFALVGIPNIVTLRVFSCFQFIAVMAFAQQFFALHFSNSFFLLLSLFFQFSCLILL